MLLLTPFAHATRAQDIRFERVDGLSHNTVFAIEQDSAGFIWIGTSDGLNRYDGYEFAVFRNVPGDTTSLSNNSVKSLLAGDGGSILVGTDDGLNRYEPAGPGFRRIVLQSPEPPGGRVAIHRLVADLYDRVWVVSDHGVFRMESRSALTARRIAVQGSVSGGHPQSRPWSLYEDADGEVWVGSNQGSLLKHDRAADVLRVVLQRRGLQLSVHERVDGPRLWLTESETPGLLEFDPASASGISAAHIAGAPELSQRTVHTIRRDSNGLVWFGTDDGLYRLDPESGAVYRAQPVRAPVDFLQNNVKSLFEDRVGALWVGTFSGLYVVDPNRKRFSHLGRDPADPKSLSGNTVMAVAEGDDGLLWVGTLGGGLNSVDPRQSEATHFRRDADDAATICSDLVWSLLSDSRGTLWVGTDEGLCSRARGSARFERHRLPTSRPRQPPVNALREDLAGQIWAATNVGLFRINPDGSRPRLIVDNDTDPATPDSALFLQSLHRARDGRMWVGAFGGDLYTFDPAVDNAGLERVRLDVSGRGELVSEGIWAIHDDTDAHIWLGSDLGLTRFDPTTGTTTHFTQRDGLPGSIVYSILDDGTPGRLWLATNGGLVRFDALTRTFRVFDAGDGLVNTEFNRRAGTRARDGTIYFGGLSGLTWFSPSEIRDNIHAPPVLITRIEKSRRDTSELVNPAAVDRLVLSYRDYTVSFGYTALNFTNPSQNRYAYQLDGFDDQWVHAGPRRFATYTNIPPGDYTFRVRGSNDDGVWSERAASLAISVTPPFWQTIWFRLLILLSVAAALVGAHRYRVKRLLEVERLRVRIAGDLHDDIGSNLSSIALLSDMVQRRGELGERERRHLTRISRSARTMVDSLRDIVWSIDPESDRVDDLVGRMKDTASVLLSGMEWTFEAPGDQDPSRMDMVTRREVFLAFKEMIHNVARHSGASRVQISLRREGEELLLTVSDNGVGFDPDAPSAGSGLRNLRERAAKMRGHLDIHSERPGGTRLSLLVPSIRGAV